MSKIRFGSKAPLCVALSAALLLATGVGTSAQELQFRIRIHDGQFVPDELKVPANVKFLVIVQNDDDAANEFDSYELHRERHVPPHSQATLYLGPLAPGRYEFKSEERTGGGSRARGILVVR